MTKRYQIIGLILGSGLLLLLLFGGLVWSRKSVPSAVLSPAGFDLAPVAEPPTLSIGGEDYVSSRYGFRFRLPEGWRVTELEDRGGEMILARQAEGGGAFQIFITPYDEPVESFSVARVQRDLPDLVMTAPTTFALSDGAGLTFVSEGPPFGESREIWFVRAGRLYQMSAYLSDEELLREVLQTWRFE